MYNDRQLELMEFHSTPDILKIDVEGAELNVLRGGSQLIDNVRPVIYCEVAKKVHRDVTQLFKEKRYQLWDGSKFDGTLQPEVSFAAFNTVAIPAENVKEYERLDV